MTEPHYCGWQTQPNGITVQEVLEKHLSELLKEPIRIAGASRTDAGVHAKGNVAVFDTQARMPAEKISYALNTRLPADIRVQESCRCRKAFIPEFAKTAKTYEYRILNRRFPDPTRRLYSFFYHYPLDVEKMQEAAGYLVVNMILKVSARQNRKWNPQCGPFIPWMFSKKGRT